MGTKSRQPVAVTPPEEPALSGDVTDIPPFKKVPPMATLSLNFILSDEFVKRVYDLLEAGKSGKEALDIIKNERTLPDEPKTQP